jgi:hypothetical protein
VWDLTELWYRLVLHLVVKLVPEGTVLLDLDDTLHHKSGRKVEGAGIFRDAVRSTGKRVVHALGLNLVVLTLRIRPPWGGEPLGLPVNVRRHPKKRLTTLKLAEAMIHQLAEWLPSRSFSLCCDGAYASLAGRHLPRTSVTSRMRRDAAIFAPPPVRRKGQRGRPKKKGKRLPAPAKIAARKRTGWRQVTVDFRGRQEQRLVLSLTVLWYAVKKDAPVNLVIVRDPSGRERDDFFFTTDLTAAPEAVATQYAGRWSIEDTFRNEKQYLGGEDPQTWKGKGPERAASLALWIYSMVWAWYLTTYGTKKTWLSRPWYPAKSRASFVDALAALRRVLWRNSISSRCTHRPLPRKTIRVLIEALARAA